MLGLFTLFCLMRGIMSIKEWSTEMTVAFLIDTVVMEEESKFWLLMNKTYEYPQGFCVFGGAPTFMDGWYSRLSPEVYIDKTQKRHLRKTDYAWELLFFFQDDDRNFKVIFSGSSSTQDEYAPVQSEWSGGERAPYVLASQNGSACEKAVNEFQTNTEGRKLLHTILSSQLHTLLSSQSKQVPTEMNFWSITALLLYLAMHYIFWRRPEQQQQPIEIPRTEADDDLGTPPSFVNQGLDSLLQELIKADQDENMVDDDEILLAAALDDALELYYLRARTTLNNDDIQNGLQFNFTLKFFLLQLPCKIVANATSFILRWSWFYLSTTTNIIQPLFLLTFLILVLTKVVNNTVESFVREMMNNHTLWLFVLALITDLTRRACLSIFWIFVYFGLGSLRNEEEIILRKSIIEELGSAFALCLLVIFETSSEFGYIDLYLACFTMALVGSLTALSRLVRARLVYLTKTRPICDQRYIFTHESMDGFSLRQFWDAYSSRTLDHLRLFGLSFSLLFIIISTSVLACRFLLLGNTTTNRRYTLTLLQVAAVSTHAGKRCVQVLLHEIVLFVTESFWPKMHILIVWRVQGALAAKRLWDKQHNVIGQNPLPVSIRRCTSSVHRNCAKDQVTSSKIAAYYVEYYTEVFDLILTLAWYLGEFFSSRMAWIFFSVFAHHTHAKLKSRLRFHKNWLAARRNLTKCTHNGLRLATENEMNNYNDVCVICLASLVEKESLPSNVTARDRRKAMRLRLPIKLPNCHHIFHLDCLRMYLSPASTETSSTGGAATCPVCRKPISPIFSTTGDNIQHQVNDPPRREEDG